MHRVFGECFSRYALSDSAALAPTLSTQNGPIQITPQYAATANKYSWDKLADFIWVDQPVYAASYQA